MRKLIVTALIALSVLTGCKEAEDGEVVLQEPTVWTTDSERLVIRENRNSRYTFYDYSRDTLPANVKTKLYALETTDKDIVCRAGGETYEITITDNSGLERVYASADGRCGDTYPWDTFIAVRAIDGIVRLLEE